MRCASPRGLRPPGVLRCRRCGCSEVSMSIRFRCYSCVRKIACPEEAMGLYLECPHCAARLRVPIPADLGEVTAEQIKARQQAQIQRAKRKQEQQAAVGPELPVARIKRAPTPESASAEGAYGDAPVARPKTPPKPPPKAHPVPDEPDILEVEMAGGDEGPNETDDLLASLAQAAGDDGSDVDMDMAVEHSPKPERQPEPEPELEPDPEPALEMTQPATGEEEGDAADLLAQLAAAAGDDEDAPPPREKEPRTPRRKRGGRRR